MVDRMLPVVGIMYDALSHARLNRSYVIEATGALLDWKFVCRETSGQ
jgi:hypothetical protein